MNATHISSYLLGGTIVSTKKKKVNDIFQFIVQVKRIDFVKHHPQVIPSKSYNSDMQSHQISKYTFSFQQAKSENKMTQRIEIVVRS